MIRLTQPVLAAALAASLTPSLLAGCGDDGGGDDDPGGERPDGAVLVAERFTTPDGRVMYMGAFPELPSQDVDISQLTELGDGDVFACGGNAFFFDSEALSITKFVVEDDLSLTRGVTLQVGQEGITGWTGAHVCASETRAFIFESTGGRAVEWNPSTMVIVDAFDVPRPTVADGLDVFFFEPYVVGDLVYFPAEALSWDTLATGEAIVGTFDLTDESMTYTYDDRCGPGLSGHVTSDGAFYRYQGYQAFFAEYGPDPAAAPDCVLRIEAGAKEFDPTYVQALGPTNNMWAIDDHTAVIMQIDPAAQLPAAEDPWSWFELPIVATAVDLRTGEMTAYPGLSNEPPMNARKLSLDGQSYFQLNSFDSEGRVTDTELMRLTPTGAEPVFTLRGGDFLTLERLW